jgi:hypothetical protein
MDTETVLAVLSLMTGFVGVVIAAFMAGFTVGSRLARGDPGQASKGEANALSMMVDPQDVDDLALSEGGPHRSEPDNPASRQ